MKSKTSLVLPLLLLGGHGAGAAQRLEELPPASPAQAEAPPASTGPQGSSQLRPGEVRYDRVGRAGHAEGEGVFALSSELAPGSFAEVTVLDNGKTILVQVRGEGPEWIALSSGAAAQLGVAGNASVRVRRVTVTPQESALLSAGQAAPPRAEAPPALLAGLRRKLAEQTPVAAAKPAPPPRPAKALPPKVRPAPAPAPQPSRATSGLFVQVAALSNAQRARALADQLGGVVRSAGNIHRIQLGPFASRAAAEKARADAARRGYGDARIISVP